MSFVAGAHVFPGGRIDAGDLLADPEACCDGLGGVPRFPDLDADGELAARVAAVRELVEEAGVLLARRDGAWATTEEAEEVRRLCAEGSPFEHVLREGGWRIALDALVPFARIVTPSSEPRRFDTHFFVAELPAGRQARAHEAESDELVWLDTGEGDGRRPRRRGRPAAADLDDPDAARSIRRPLPSSSPGRAGGGSSAWSRCSRTRRARRRSRFLRRCSPPSGGDATTGPQRFSPAKGGGWRPVAPA